MQGTRIPDGDYPTNPGEYSKHQIEGNTVWFIKVPTNGPACLLGRPNKDGSPYHWVKENGDGTITIEPNPPDAPPERRNSNSIGWNAWHGYIYSGVFQAA